MKTIKLGLLYLASIGLFFLASCSNQGTNSEQSAETNPDSIAQETHSEDDGHDHSPDDKEIHSENDGHDHSHDKAEGEHSHGGQVIESGEYHLELVAEPSDEGTHLDFYLEKGEAHEKVSNAQVNAQIQLPNGEQKSVPLTYEVDGNHYHGILSETESGEYQVAILSDINGEKVNGRFSFKR